MTHDAKQDKVHDLVYTRINGNNIKTYPVYVAMLKAVTKQDIKDYACSWSYELACELYGSKVDMIEQVKNHITEGC